jgi:hypothetical protein
MQQGLSLSTTTGKVAPRAIPFDLRNVTSRSTPSLYLAQIVLTTPAGIVATVPLKPAARIIVMDPTFFPPNG